MNIEHISVSRRQIYKECPQKYKYQYHLKVDSKEPAPFYFTYGKIIHKIAEEYVSKKGELQLNEIAYKVINGEIAIEQDAEGKDVFAPTIPPDYKQRMPSHIRAIQRLTTEIGTDGIVEYHFKYDLEPPNEKYVTGFIDRLINRGDKWFIIDYKTTKRGPWRKDSSTISEDMQLRCYARVVQKEFGVKAENIKAALYYLEGGSLVATNFTEHSLLSAEQDLLETYNQIAASDPDRVMGKTGRHCRFCDFNKICPFYLLK